MLPTEPLPPPRRDSQLRSIFVGPYGLRAGWRVLIFVAILVVLVGITLTLRRTFFPHASQEFSAPTVAVGEGLTFLLLLVATGIMAKFEHRSVGDYGLPARGMFGKNFWAGALWGFVMLSVIIAMMAATHSYSFGSLALSPFEVLKFGFLWAVGFVMVGFFEEFTFRGYVQYTLTWGLGFWPAAAITCLLFALGHSGNPGESWVGVAEIVLIAMFLCLALRRTGNLWFAIGWHMAFDWGESFFYSTPNSGIHATGHMLNASLMGSKWLSGGSVGPEASVFDLVVTIAGILLLAKLYPHAKYPERRPALDSASSTQRLPPSDEAAALRA
jgi:membrane protease YdiL (CAAX protease family)